MKIKIWIAFKNADFEFKSRVDTFKDKDRDIRSSLAFTRNSQLDLSFCLYDGDNGGQIDVKRGKKLLGKEALFVILGLKRVKEDDEKLDKFVKTHVSRLLKMDMVAVPNELERQEEVQLAVKGLAVGTVYISAVMRHPLNNVGVSSWFLEISPALSISILMAAFVWVEIEGVPLKTMDYEQLSQELSPGVPGWTPDLLEDSDEEELSMIDSLKKERRT
ncbi:thylakoid assembly 8-like protein, chloroplastic [Tanacetum coccineum]|uniref:Thylakoid assembly 8-like protein, chloroplastic n=1 Tax=Tanacetum coccineum TaxID=301880 RepID=A0ABQ5J8C4_9ASTR